jgi:hypothetical protein
MSFKSETVFASSPNKSVIWPATSAISLSRLIVGLQQLVEALEQGVELPRFAPRLSNQRLDLLDVPVGQGPVVSRPRRSHSVISVVSGGHQYLL